MIYITGDTHGDRARLDNLRGEERWTAGDTLIICGDFGFLFADSIEEQAFLDHLACKPYTICFIDGNHENFHAIYRYPVEEWKGGKVHRIRSNIIHLMRGQVFTIEGKTFFTMGGAYSRDRWRRQLNVSYWEEEIPCEAEYREADRSLKAHDYTVDYVLTHTAPREVIRRIGYVPAVEDGELCGFLEDLYHKLRFRHWYCGHFHENWPWSDKLTLLYWAVKEV